MNRVDSLYRESGKLAGFARGYLDYLRDLLAKMDEQQIAAFIELLYAARKRDARIYLIGNGGSAVTASHFANDIAMGSRSWDRPFRALSLADNTAILTALANDYGYEEIFVRQLKNQMQAGDVVVAISASGDSPNVLRAVEFANQCQGVTVGITGFDGGELREIARHSVHVPTEAGEYGPTEDLHLVVNHLVGAYLICHSRAEQQAKDSAAE